MANHDSALKAHRQSEARRLKNKHYKSRLRTALKSLRSTIDEGDKAAATAALPATYSLLRVIVVLERGTYDDPTELASHDRPFQVAAAVFGLLTVALMCVRQAGWIPPL